MNEWMNNPMFQNLDPIKQELLTQAAAQVLGKSGRALAPVMMSLITGANKKGVRFSPEEINLILGLLKEGKSKEEQEQIDRTIQMVTTMLQRNRK